MPQPPTEVSSVVETSPLVVLAPPASVDVLVPSEVVSSLVDELESPADPYPVPVLVLASPTEPYPVDVLVEVVPLESSAPVVVSLPPPSDSLSPSEDSPDVDAGSPEVVSSLSEASPSLSAPDDPLPASASASSPMSTFDCEANGFAPPSIAAVHPPKPTNDNAQTILRTMHPFCLPAREFHVVVN